MVNNHEIWTARYLRHRRCDTARNHDLLLQVNKLQSAGLLYSLLNAFGAGLIILSLLDNFNLSAFLMEAFWVLISLVGVVRYLRRPLPRPDVQL